MNALPFIVGAYAVTLVGTLGLGLLSFLQMRKAEREAESLRREP